MATKNYGRISFVITQTDNVGLIGLTNLDYQAYFITVLILQLENWIWTDSIFWFFVWGFWILCVKTVSEILSYSSSYDCYEWSTSYLTTSLTRISTIKCHSWNTLPLNSLSCCCSFTNTDFNEYDSEVYGVAYGLCGRLRMEHGSRSKSDGPWSKKLFVPIKWNYPRRMLNEYLWFCAWKS